LKYLSTQDTTTKNKNSFKIVSAFNGLFLVVFLVLAII
jgi:hypothetical protein